MSADAALLGRSAAAAALRAAVQSAARRDATILLLAPPGADPAQVARSIHAASARARGPFVEVDAGQGGVSARELLAAAERGTLYVEGVDRLPPEDQPRLTRFLDERRLNSARFDVRVIASTAANLSELIRLGRFDAELYFRIAVHPVRVPPLDGRREDAPIIAAHWLRERERVGQPARAFDAAAYAALASCAWPGDVEQLRRVVERAAATPGDSPVSPAAVAAALRADTGAPLAAAAPAPPPFAGPCDLDAILAQTERALIEGAMARADGVVAEAARLLGLRRTTLIDRLKRHGLSRPTATTECRRAA